MKNLYNNLPITCETIEELSIKQAIETLSADENNLLKQHLKTCVHCQEFQNQLASLQSSITISEKSPLKPDPAIHQSLMKRMNAYYQIKRGTVDSFWQRLVNFLEYRIPVYQGLIGLAGSLLILVAINYFSFSGQQQSDRPEYPTNPSDTSFYQINVIKNLQIIEEQKIGKSVSEDSLLTRFIVTAM